ncbi:MAG TPA: glucose dehydrogenase [Gammaproteobacteria bacterium]|nr:glucose dehydrogenase [Gammaproteobacteria bacterium]
MLFPGGATYSGRRLAVAALLFLGTGALHAASTCIPAAPPATWPPLALRPVATGLEQPVFLTTAPGAADTLYVVEQQGTVRRIVRGVLDGTPWLDLRDRVSSGGEKGLLSLAFHPDFAVNGQLYVNYTGRAFGLYTFVSRFTVGDGGRPDPDGETKILKIKQPFGNHNGGQIAFGPDGYLYIGMGDGGWANDPFGHGQDPGTLLGALLRIDVNRAAPGRPYGIPPDNPFVTDKQARPEVWAYGLRNPWRFSFDRASGRLYLADVGQNDVEEIDRIEKGGNYGWNVMEGDRCFKRATCPKAGFQAPLHVYHHPTGFAVTGGYVYRGAGVPALCGVYLFADYVSRKIWGLRETPEGVTVKLLVTAPDNISSFGEDGRGGLYVLGHKSGTVWRLVAAEEP